MDNFRIRDFEDKVINLFNSSDLPIEVKRLVVQNTLNLIELNKQREERDNISVVLVRTF